MAHVCPLHPQEELELREADTQPVIAQPLDFGINVSQDGSKTACRRHGSAQTSTKTASDSIDSLSAFKRIASTNHIPA